MHQGELLWCGTTGARAVSPDGRRPP